MTHARGSILLVDDEEKIVKSLGRALREAGHTVVDTTNPRQAQRLLAERPFDVLVAFFTERRKLEAAFETLCSRQPTGA